MKASSFKYLVHQGFSGIWKNRMMTFASFCILLVSLLMVGLASLTAINLTRVIGGIEDKSEVVVIISDDADDKAKDELKTHLEEIPNVNSITMYSKEEAWDGMLDSMTDEEKEFFKYADENPLPDTYRLTVKDIKNMGETTAIIETLDNVESTQSPTTFADILINIRRIFSIVAVAVVAALVVVSLIIISNTTRASVFARRKEINIMKYVGATNAFIRIPFFVEGMIVGLVAAVGALLLTKFAYEGVYNIFSDNFNIWSILGMQKLYAFKDLLFPVSVSYLAAGAVIGAVGTSISTGKHLKV
ncbi:MAG: permease-like cell division protein FtsX [Ruminococcus sp.]|nr:permease-like cell division protein FtsX [Ruminococcus sp.]MBP3798332.1 permease-like cell division protein FtsX [Ruminococcus sp.]MBQ1431705.1 permease-like cell division protein FtsX [Ruminococcus sp.]